MPAKNSAPVKPMFFATSAAWRRWLQKNHDSAPELWVGFYKKASGNPSITWPESVDQALCFGWIDGIRKTVDDDSYMIRFTPRKPGSLWSMVNTRRAHELIAEGLMLPAGEAAFAKRDEKKSRAYSFERDTVAFEPALEKQFRSNATAWTFFESLPPGYRRTVTWWVMSAKQDATRQRRLSTLIADCAAGRRIKGMER